MSISELYSVIVVVCGISPSYFLDEMQMYEIDACLDGISMKYRPNWEQCRMVSYMIAQVNSTKQLKPTDIMKFEWDNTDIADHSNTTITDEDIMRLTEKANKYIQSFNTDGGSSDQTTA